MTIEQLAVEAMKAGKTNREVLGLVKRAFPTSKTTIKGVYFYSSKHKDILPARGNKSKADPAGLASVLNELKKVKVG